MTACLRPHVGFRLAVFAALLLAATMTSAQTFPVKPVRIITGSGPGTSPDVQIRIVAERLPAEWKQQPIIENLPGASSNIAAERVANAAPDGYTLFYASIGPLTINMHLFSKLNYDIVRDFAPITQFSKLANVLVVHPSVPVMTVGELVALAKKRPGDLRYGSGGNGTSQHLCAEMLRSMTGIQYLHVPYKSSPQMTIDVISGQLDLAFHQPVVVIPHAKAGRLRAIAVTSDNRQAWAPELPTVAESGVPGFEITVGSGLLAPRKTPPEIVEKLNADMQRALALPAVKEAYARNYMEVTARGTKDFAVWQKAEIEKMGKLVRASGAKLD
jgi:tripartite-type tricarboxylate transporter receptor subunit TctC